MVLQSSPSQFTEPQEAAMLTNRYWGSAGVAPAVMALRHGVSKRPAAPAGGRDLESFGSIASAVAGKGTGAAGAGSGDAAWSRGGGESGVASFVLSSTPASFKGTGAGKDWPGGMAGGADLLPHAPLLPEVVTTCEQSSSSDPSAMTPVPPAAPTRTPRMT